jgi:hypothetical protein
MSDDEKKDFAHGILCFLYALALILLTWATSSGAI